MFAYWQSEYKTLQYNAMFTVTDYLLREDLIAEKKQSMKVFALFFQ